MLTVVLLFVSAWVPNIVVALSLPSKVHGARLTGAVLEIDAVSVRVVDSLKQAFDLTYDQKFAAQSGLRRLISLHD